VISIVQDRTGSAPSRKPLLSKGTEIIRVITSMDQQCTRLS
jgi:hypothetical protein